MRTMNISSFVRRALNSQGGQVLPWVTVMFAALLGMAGVTTDVGEAYAVKAQLQNSANAAALASVHAMYNNGTNDASGIATSYSGSSGGYNVGDSNVTVSTQVYTPCLNYLAPGNTGCTNTGGNASGTSSPNAVRVVETAIVPTRFMRIWSQNSITVQATAQASIGVAMPWNVAIILDATPSMSSVDKYCTTSNTTAEQCALKGIQTMLSGIPPCKGTSSCTSSDANALFRVSMFTFPNVETSNVYKDYTCGDGQPHAKNYTLPVIPPNGSTSGYMPITYTAKSGTSGSNWEEATYQILSHSADTVNIDANGFASDYYDATQTTKLNSNSLLVKTVGNGSTNPCLVPPGDLSGDSGETYFAGAIYAAQAALLAEQAAVSNLGIKSNNAIIFVSDGQANTDDTHFPQATSIASTNGGVGGYSVTTNGSSSTNLIGTAGAFGQYPDFNDACQQAIMAANYAKGQGTRVYGVAYGSEPNGCTQDSNVVVTGTLNVPITSASQVIPCVVMEDIASPGITSSDPWYFYSEGSSAKNGCTDTSHMATNLQSIFGAITTTFVAPRLLPNTVN